MYIPLPTKMCIKSAPHVHKKGYNWALKWYSFFCFGADVTH